MFKMLSNVYDGNVIPDIKLRTDVVSSNMMNRKNSKQVFEKYARSEVSRNSFICRSAKIWNDLPEDVISATNVNTFKNRLDKHWENHPARYENGMSGFI